MATYNSTTCMTSYSGKTYMTHGQVTFLLLYDILTAVGNIIANSLVILALVLSKQTGNPSLKLILFLSVSDCCLAVVAQTLFAVMLGKYPTSTNCDFEMTAMFFAILLTHTSGYIIALIGFDRFARVKYLTKYAHVMTPSRVRNLLVIVIILSIIQASIYVIGTSYDVFDTTKKIAIAVDFLIALTVVFFTIMAVKAVKDHRKGAQNQEMLKSVDNTVTKLASKILITIVVFYIIYVIIGFVHSAKHKSMTGRSRSWIEFAVFFGYLLTYTNSLANAVIFLSVNKKARRVLMKKWSSTPMLTNSSTHHDTTEVSV